VPLIATIVLGLTDFEAVTVSLGVFLIVAAFAISGIVEVWHLTHPGNR